jgi:hypothetical protein
MTSQNLVADSLARFLNRWVDLVFTAEVTSKSGNRVAFIRNRPGAVAEGPYPALEGVAASVTAGDRVLVIDTTGDRTFVVIGRVRV